MRRGTSGRILTWDSQFFGITVARITPEDGQGLVADDEWCKDQGVAVAYLLVPAQDIDMVLRAEALGFRVVDIRLVLVCETERQRPATQRVPSDLTIEEASQTDVPALEQIAATGHRDSRFYADPWFPTERCDALYATWIRRSCEQPNTVVLVARSDDEVAGYISVQEGPDADHATIDLIAVAENQRGRGVGPGLVGRGLETAATAGARKVSVATQGRNLPAQRLYQRSGMVSDSVSLWLHKWYDASSE